MSSPYIIYALIDPRDQQVRYIGKTVRGRERYRQHNMSSALKNDGNTHKANWIKSLHKLELKPNFLVLQELDVSLDKVIANKELYKLEQKLIKEFRFAGYDLTNLGDGGPGMTGMKYSEETRKKLSESAKKRPLPQALLDNQKRKYQEGQSPTKIKKKLGLYPRYRINKNTKYQGRQKFRKPVIGIDAFNGDFISFDGLRNAASIIGGRSSKTGISLAIKNNKPYYGYYWMYNE